MEMSKKINIRGDTICIKLHFILMRLGMNQ